MALTAAVTAAPPKHHKRTVRKHKVVHVVKHAPSGAETSLVGVSLFDKGIQVIAMYGTPDIISPANVATPMGSNQGQPGAGGGGGFGAGIRGGRPGGGGPGMGPGRGPGMAPGGPGGGADDLTDPSDGSDLGSEVLNQRGQGGAMTPPGMGPGRGPGMGPGGPGMGPGRGPMGPGGPGMGPGGPGGPGGAGRFGGPNSGGGAQDNVIYTRWTYFRGASRYAFVFDKFNRVVQIEAIGIDNAKVRTKRGIGFGNNFASLIKTYGPPDGYDIAGDNSLTIRYLLNAKVAFRLSRLGAKKPPVVTGIVVAAAKG